MSRRARTNGRISRMISLVALVAAASLGGCASGPSAAAPKAKPTAYAFWPQFPDKPFVQYVKSYGGSTDVAPSKETTLDKMVFGSDAARGAAIVKPYGVAMKNGKIYVCDIRSNALAVLDLRKKQTRLVGVSGATQIKNPVAVAVADDGMIYVADNEQASVLVFDANERFSRVIGHPKFKPASLATFGDRLYVTDMATQSVEVYNRRDGKQIGKIGGVGDSDGQFRLPLGVATDREGNVYVVDMMRCVLQKFSPEGSFVWSAGTLGDAVGCFVRPKHVAVDSEGIIYVVDAAFQNVQMFNKDKQVLMHFGAAGDFPGAMNLPAGVCVNEGDMDLFADLIHPGFAPKRIVVVTNQFGADKVSLYAFGELKAGYSAEQLAASAAPVHSGMDANPSSERLQMQNVANEEPAPEPSPEGGTPGTETPAEKPK